MVVNNVCVCVGGVYLLARSDSVRPVLYLCTVWKESRQRSVPSHCRLAFSTSTCATGQKTTSSERAPCRPSQLSSFAPGRAFWICSASTSPTQHPRASPALTFATPGRTGWSWSGCPNPRSFPRISMTSSSTGVWLCPTLRALRRMRLWTTGGARVRSQTGRVSWRSCWRLPWQKASRLIWWFQTQRRFSTVPYSGWSRAKFPTYLIPRY